MDEALEKMTKLANELCDQLEKAEADNRSLREKLAQMRKSASEVSAPAPAVSAEVAQSTCDALVKAGSISADQVEDCKKAFIEDPEAAHRTLVEILNAPAQEKTASVEADLSGGILVSGTTQDSQDKMASVYQILGLNL